MLKVLKFGGSSMADAHQLEKVRSIVEADPARRVVVVSAAGKRFKDDHKITDLLYLCHAHLQYGVSCDGIFDMVRSRYLEIRDELGLSTPLEAEFDALRAKMDKGISADELVSRGEYFAARIMADCLGFDFLDSSLWLHFRMDGTVDQEASYQALVHAASGRKVVIPGFYGVLPDGSIHTFSRGGSDITGALAAAALDADVYENWTDVPGIFRADPAIVPSARAIPAMAYDEVRELAYMGANVLHEDAVTPARRMGIPIHIRSTMQPDAPGTLVSSQSPPSACPVTGIAGRKGYCSIQVEKENMNSAVGYCRRILSVLETHEIPFDHIATGLGSISFIAPAAAVSACREALLSDISAAVRPDSICVADGLAMVSIVGRDMAGRPGVSGRLLCALGRAGINVRMVVQGTREINITVGISEPEYEKAVHAVHGEFFPEAPQ